MSALAWILGTTFAISLVALTGALTLFLTRGALTRLLPFLVALAAGALLGGAFLHLLPEALERGGSPDRVFASSLVGFTAFFVLDQFIHWHHHHGAEHAGEPVTYLVLVADTVHNFIDGVVIAGAFLVSVPVGLVTALVIALHEIPQEIGDFGVLVHGGIPRRRALVLNYGTAVSVVAGGVVGFLLAEAMQGVATALLPFAAGSFIYIAATDLIPEIQREERLGRSLAYFGTFLLGLGGIALVAAFGPHP